MESHLRNAPEFILDYKAHPVAITITPTWMGHMLEQSPQGSSRPQPRRGTLLSVGINEATLKCHRSA